MRRGILLVAVALEHPQRVDPRMRAFVARELVAYRWLAMLSGVA